MAACAATLGDVAKKIWAAGQSTGGTMALAAASTLECFVGAVAFAPFSDLEAIIRDNMSALSVLENHFGPLEERHYQAANATKLVRGFKKPVLIVQGTDDKTVPIEHGRLLSRQIGPNARFLPIEGANHHLRNIDRSSLIAEVVSWFDQQ
jgi:dipeptidyl aminopeptidase/acylaminoacyl peptidase